VEYAKQETSMKAVHAACLHADFLLGLFFNPKNGGDVFLQNVG
jgi:hypothetical protein